MASPADPGEIYLMRWHGEFKIGIARDVARRYLGLNSKFPGITIVHTFASYSMRYAEMRLHERFAHRHLRLEWFALTPEDVAEFRTYRDYQWDSEFIRRGR